MASVLTNFAEQLEELVAKGNFTSVSVGINTAQAAASRYDAALHYSDATKGLGCSLGHGATIAAAINAAYRDSVAKRPIVVADLVAEAA